MSNSAHSSASVRALEALRGRFNIPGVRFETGEGGLPRVAVETPAARAVVYLHGAHIAEYKPAGQGPVLFMSGKSLFASGKPIRGGVPICFPWFGPKADDPSAAAHGLVRTASWDLASASAEGDSVRLTFALAGSSENWPQWPHDVKLRFAVTIGPSLDMELNVANPAAAAGPFTFEEALHTYLAVADVRKVQIDGLAEREYLDKTDGMKRKRQNSGTFGIEAETDRVYLATTDTVRVADGPRTITVAKTGSDCTVVWNPWVAKSKALLDFGDDEWPGMLCIETANVAEYAITLQPGESHGMTAKVSVD